MKIIFLCLSFSYNNSIIKSRGILLIKIKTWQVEILLEVLFFYLMKLHLIFLFIHFILSYGKLTYLKLYRYLSELARKKSKKIKIRV